ncbi:hypothetical protein [Crocosphaera sp. Alani8]|uniref:hypothetical protein n=1 Tax=Crocosphaera sp. Alani8 TaxID=3038952 RepID=UPI00313CE1A7
MVSKLAVKKSVNYLRKLSITFVIVGSLGSHLIHNTSLKSPIFPNLFARFTTLTGMSSQWRMFSVVDRFSWKLEIVAIHKDKKVTTLPIFTEENKGFFEKQFINFREGKLHQSLFVYPQVRYHYSSYLCRIYHDKTNHIQAIRYDLFWRKILPPGQAAIRNQYLTEEFSDIGKLGEYKCQN